MAILRRLLVLSFLLAEVSASAKTGNISWWSGGVAKGFEEARNQGKPIFVFWTATWCPPCKVLKSKLFPDQQFQRLLDGFVPIYLDSDDPDAGAFGARWDITGFPTLLVFNSYGREMMRFNYVERSAEQWVQLIELAGKLTRPLADIAAMRTPEQFATLTTDEWRLIAGQNWNYQKDGTLFVDVWDKLRALTAFYQHVPEELTREKHALYFLYLSGIRQLEHHLRKEKSKHLLPDFDQFLDQPEAVYHYLNQLFLGTIELLTDDQEKQQQLIRKIIAHMTAFRQQPRPYPLPAPLFVKRVASFTLLIRWTKDHQPKGLPSLRRRFAKWVADEYAALDKSDALAHSIGLEKLIWRFADLKHWSSARKYANIGLNLPGSDQAYRFAGIHASLALEQQNPAESLTWMKKAYELSRGDSTRLMYGSHWIKAVTTHAPKGSEQLTIALETVLRGYFSVRPQVSERDHRRLQKIVKGIFKWRQKHPEVTLAVDATRACGDHQLCRRLVAGLGTQESLPPFQELPLLAVQAMTYNHQGENLLALAFRNRPGWHTYYKEPGEFGRPMQFRFFSGEQPIEAELLGWPKYKTFEEQGGLKTHGYDGQYVFFFKLASPMERLSAKVSYLICGAQCIPKEANLEIDFRPNYGFSSQAAFELRAPLRQHFDDMLPHSAERIGAGDSTDGRHQDTALWWILCLAFLGGLILNLMPCVLPVISFKLFGLIKMAHLSRREIMGRNLIYAAGVLTSFMVLAAAVLALKALGHQIGWGFQLQSPYFVAAMVVVLCLISWNLFGLFEVAAFGATTLNRSLDAARLSPHVESFFTGFLATVLATPCSAPFLGTALAFAFSASWPIVLLVFATIALGLSAPFLAIGFFPSAIRFLPKPGNWMNHLRLVLGLLTLLTALWMHHVFNSLVENKDVVFNLNVFVAMLFFVFAGKPIWERRRWLQALAVVLALTCGAYTIDKVGSDSGDAHRIDQLAWQRWSPQLMESLRAARKPAFIDVTAEWCLTCKVTETLVLETEAFRQLLAEYPVSLIKADWTERDPDITKLLQAHGYAGVPAYFMLDPLGRLHPLGETLSIAKLRDYMARLVPGP